MSPTKKRLPMTVLEWTRKLVEKPSAHPMASTGSAAELLEELPLNDPAKAIAECAAWLESIELETSFSLAHQLDLVAMIDEAGRSSVHELVLTYIGARPGTPARMQDWRALMDYLERLSTAYALGIEGYTEGGERSLRARMPSTLSRMVRTITEKMKIGWMRYVPPDRACWEALAHGYRVAETHGMSKTMIRAYTTDAAMTCAAHEFNVAVMLAAAAPQGLPPRQIELTCRIATASGSAFEVSSVRDETWRYYLFDLNMPGPPARIPEQLSPSDGLLFFSAAAVLSKIAALVEDTHRDGAGILRSHYGDEFGASEKIWALEHLRRFWGDSPPSRREQRTRINTSISVAVGVPSIQCVLGSSALSEAPDEGPAMLVDIAADSVIAVKADAPAAPDHWLLTDFSPRGIGARCSRRADGWLRVGSLFGFKLERSDKWCIAIVRRLRTDTRNQVDVGAEILAKAACLVELEGCATPASAAAGARVLRSGAVLLPDDPLLDERPSLLFEPRTNAPGQTFFVHGPDGARQIRLGQVTESLDGWDRVEFDWID